VSCLQDKSIVIIGGTTGLGLSAARALVHAGARVVVAGRNPENAARAEQELGPSSRALVGDATLPATAPQAIQLALQSFQGFHGLYHVAGGSGRRQGDGSLHEITDQGWHETLHLNLTSLFLSNRAALNQFLLQKSGGSILNMASVLGFSPSPKFFGTHAYATAKAAIIGLTQAGAAYYAPHNIRLNVLAPALVATPMSERAQTNQDIMAFIQSKQPLDGGRIGRPEDLDAAVVFFMSDASAFATGQVLAIDGGWCLSEGQFSKTENS
jgi:NAD(P)-dependent dehydrogenase (short-subunit alcohol dehydrogenase family)